MTAARPRKPSLRSIAARNALVVENYALAFWVIERIEWLPSVISLGREEAENHAVDALIRAAELWDESFGTRFSTYAVMSIRRRVLSAAGKRFRRFNNDDGTEEWRCPERRLIETETDLPLDRYGEPEIPVEDDTDRDGLLDLPAALREIPDREYTVLMYRHRDGLTHREIGERMEISPARARQLEGAGLKRLRLLMKGATT